MRIFFLQTCSKFLKLEGIPFLRFLAKASMLLLLGPFMSCSSNGNGAAVTMTLSTNSLTMINAGTISCAGYYSQSTCATGTTQTSYTAPTIDVQGLYVQIPIGALTIGWSNTSSPISLVYLDFVLKSSAIQTGSYQGTIGIPELGYAWATSFYNAAASTTSSSCTTRGQMNPTISSSSKSLPSDSSTWTSAWYTQNECPLTVGGIKLVDTSRSASGTGTLYLYGTYQSGSNIQGATAQLPFSFTYLGNGPGS